MNLDSILIVCYCIDFFLCFLTTSFKHVRSLEQIATCECEGSDFLVQWRACLAGFESMQPMGFVTFLLLNHGDRLFEDRFLFLFVPKISRMGCQSLDTSLDTWTSPMLEMGTFLQCHMDPIDQDKSRPCVSLHRDKQSQVRLLAVALRESQGQCKLQLPGKMSQADMAFREKNNEELASEVYPSITSNELYIQWHVCMVVNNRKYSWYRHHDCIFERNDMWKQITRFNQNLFGSV